MVYSYFLNWVFWMIFLLFVTGNIKLVETLKKKKIEEEVSENLGVDN